MAESSEHRNISDIQVGDHNFINQGSLNLHLSATPLSHNSPYEVGGASRRPDANAPQPRPDTAVRVIPYPRNEDLVHRQEHITRLDELLPLSGQTRRTHLRSAALSGLGGSGKTQIALEYAYRRCDEDADCSVFWVHADNKATFTADYKTIGEKLGVPVDGEGMLERVRKRIEARPPWVMIVDNADDLKLFIEDGETNTTFHRFLPHDFGGSVLWTTRDGSIAGTVVGPRQSIAVHTMTNDEAVLLLARLRNDSSTTDEDGLDALLEELEHLPLAVSQAAAFMRHTSMSIKDYLGLLSRGKSRWDVLGQSRYDRHRRPAVSNSILETWRISIQRIREESEMSYRILHAIAFLGSQDIPHELVVAASGEVVEPTLSDDDGNARARSSKVTDHELDLEVHEAISRLQKFSFLSMVRENGTRRGYDMHKLVQEAVRYGLTMEENGDEAYFAKIAVHIVWSTFPESRSELWALCDQYLPHARQIARWAELSGMKLKVAAVSDDIFNSLYRLGRFGEMEAAAQLSLKLRQETFGDHDTRTLDNKHRLARIYNFQLRYKKSEAILKELIETSQQVLGDEDSVTLNGKVLLATVYSCQGHWDDAEPLAVEALATVRQKWREDGWQVANAKNTLARVYEQQKRWEDAELLRLEALKSAQRSLGKEHFITLSYMRGLIRNRIAQGQCREVEPEVKTLLHVHQRVLGEDTLGTLDCMSDLADTYSGQKKWENAEALQREILKAKQRHLGEQDPATINTIANLAAIYFSQGQYDKAEPLQRQVLEIWRRLLGEDHLTTLSAMKALARTYYRQGRYDGAETLDGQVLAILRRLLGDGHSDTQLAMDDLAQTYTQQRRFHDAERLLESVCDIRRRTLGDTHPDTIEATQRLAHVRSLLKEDVNKHRKRMTRALMRRKGKGLRTWKRRKRGKLDDDHHYMTPTSS